MSFQVTKCMSPLLVLPAKSTPAGSLPLTSTDKTRLFLSFTSFHVFDRPIDEPAETIRRALSQALVHYYPVAGRVAVGANGDWDVHIACTGEGVAFAAATASCTLQDVRFLRAPLAIPPADLAFLYSGRCGLSDPLLMMQVTEFACGGYVVGVTWNHGVADAFGLAQFLQAVGELARGLPSPSVVPVRYDESLRDIWQLFTVTRRSPADVKHVNFAYSDVAVPWSFVNSIKAEIRDHAGGQPCTVFEVVTAAIWQCRTRAIKANPDALTPLIFTANVRKQIGAKDGYYGNCISSQVVTATAGTVANGAVVDLVKLIQRVKERIPDSLTGAGELAFDEELIAGLRGYNALYLSTWGGIGLDGVDFGGGRPARVVPHMEKTVVPSCFPCLPCLRKDAGDGCNNVVAFCVTAEHVEEFHAELAKLR